jgi:hypothetical protein
MVAKKQKNRKEEEAGLPINPSTPKISTTSQ